MIKKAWGFLHARAARLLRLPMFMRFFAGFVLLTIIASTLFGAVFGAHQERVTAVTLAPLWAAGVRAEQTREARSAGVVQVQVPINLRVGVPPDWAYSVMDDQRSRALVYALLEAGLSVADVRLDDERETPITWLQIRSGAHAGGAPFYWAGFEGGLQPSLFRARTAQMLLVLLGLMAMAAWFVSRWIARPLTRLSRQVDGMARGEIPTEPVRGPREIEQLGRALAAMARQRAQFDEQRRVMMMGVSHDLRSPLTRIRVAADLLNAQPELRDLMVRNIEHADAIIESFLSYVRTDAEPLHETVDLSAVAGGAARLAGLAADCLRIGPGLCVRGNATLLQRLIANLLDNAARHGAPPVRLTVQGLPQRATVRLTVEDRGAGIADPQRMLQPFERGDASRAEGGAGLGLAVVARIVERHGGTLAIERSDDGGARVTVDLPQAPAR